MPTATGRRGLGDTPPAVQGSEVVTPLIKKALGEGMPPAAVADLVADAITAGRFWVLPHPEFVELAARRWRRIADGEDPELEVDVPGLAAVRRDRRPDQGAAGDAVGLVDLVASHAWPVNNLRNATFDAHEPDRGISRMPRMPYRSRSPESASVDSLCTSAPGRPAPGTRARRGGSRGRRPRAPSPPSPAGSRSPSSSASARPAAPRPPRGRRGCSAATATRVALEPLGEDLPRSRRIVSDQRGGAERPLPRRGLERRRTAEAEHRRPRLRGHRVPVRGRVGDEHVRPRRRVVGVAVDRECRPPGRDEVQLLVGESRVLGVRLDDVLPRLAGGVGVAAERAHPEREPDRMPGQAAGAGDRVELVEANDLRRLGRKRG